MNALNGLFRRLLPRRNNNRNEYAFELLRSTSARELKSNNRLHVKRSHLPRFYSEHNQMPSSTTAISSSHSTSDDVIEMFGEGSELMPGDQSIMLIFINGSNESFDSPSCSSSYGSEFPSEDCSLDLAVSQTHLIRSNPLFTEGVLLKCVDAHPLFPYLHYSIFKGSDYDTRISNMEHVMSSMNLHSKCQFGAYDEIYSIHRTSPTNEAQLPSHRHAGYIVISFKILEEQTRQDALEKSWLSWSGAREIYKYSSRSWNLRRISLHKIPKRRIHASRSFAYVMMCEFGSILHPSNRLQALDMCERLRVRNCGYISLYQVQWSYRNSASSPETPISSLRRDRNPMLRGLSQEVDTTKESSSRHRTPKLRVRDHSSGYNMEEAVSPVFHSYHHFSDFT